jgi:hypothetical protein
MDSLLKTSFVVIALIAGCTRAEPSALGVRGEERTSCAASWATTASWAMTLQREPANGLGAPFARLVTSDISPDFDGEQATIDLEIVGPRVTFPAGEPFDRDQDLDAMLAKNMWRFGKLHDPGEVPSIDVAISPDVTWALVVDTVERARRAGYVRVEFWFERAGHIEPPHRAWSDVDARLWRWIEEARVFVPWPRSLSQFLPEIDAVLAPCPDLAHLAHRDADGFVAALSAFDDECRCRVNQSSLRSVLWQAHPADLVTGRTITLVEDSTHAIVLDAPADETWSRVAPRVAALPSHALTRLRVAQ